MVESLSKVDWDVYAQKYDMLLDYNPYYQILRREILREIADWPIRRDDLIADIGAGTGNYSLTLAQQYPQARILHIDNNPAMNAIAAGKQLRAGIRNLQILPKGIDSISLPPNSLAALLSVHALYAFPDPWAALSQMYDWLQPGGIALLVDPGRIVQVIPWQLAIGWHLFSRYGLAKTLDIFKEARTVSEQNRYIRKMQRQGTYWTHSPEAFRQSVQAAGFTILRSRVCFRGLSDSVLVTKR